LRAAAGFALLRTADPARVWEAATFPAGLADFVPALPELALVPAADERDPLPDLDAGFDDASTGAAA
jgi:hypothetical protein